MSIVSVEKVSKFYGKKKVLDNVSFTIQRGEIFGLLGSNGAGKSTLTSIILGIEKATSGSVSLFDSTDVNISKPRFALVPQEDAFYRDFSVEKNLLFFGSIYGLSGEVLKNRVKFLLAWLYLEDYKNIRADFLSGGFQKLLNIAISLLHDPELIFLDEPTVGLDPKMRQLFWDKILELKNNGKTIILTTHYMDEAQKLCSRVALLKKGKLLAVGAPYDLIKKYGGVKIVIFKIKGGVLEKDLAVVSALVNQPSLVQKGELLFIPFKDEKIIGRITAVTEHLLNKGYDIMLSTTKEPDLEDVFLNLIGEGVGD